MSLRLVVSLSLLSAIVICCTSSPRAEEGKLPQQGHLVAILDYDNVLQNSLRYKTDLEKLKSDTWKVESEFKTQSEKVRQLEEAIKGLQPGSPDFVKHRDEATYKKHELQARIQLERTKYEEQRVQLEAAVMKQIDNITQQISVENNIAMVTNVATRQPQFHDLESTERHRQRPVVYFNPGLDLTNLVLTKMNNAFNEEAKLTPEERAAKVKVRPGPRPDSREPAKK